MCGIVGFTRRDQVLTQEDIKNGERALEILSSRGPDHQSFYKTPKNFLGHTRLSIIDTSDAANQPFHDEKLTLIFNGEIYNFKAIKKELVKLGHRFSTSSDTEVVIKAYKEWGDSCTKKFDGMWAFCIYDEEKNELFLSRDRIGEKPLVYSYDENVFNFSSEVEAILSRRQKGKTTPDRKALSNFSIHNFKHIPTPHTAFDAIKKLEPGYNLHLNLNTRTLTKDKYLKIDRVVIDSDPIDQCQSILEKSVTQTCYADVPVGIFLSGGIDSSLIACMLQDRNIITYSLGQDDNDPEIIRADKIAKHLGLKNKKIFRKDIMNPKNIIENLIQVIQNYAEPVNLMQIVYNKLILEEMKKEKIKVAVGGNGADELFYGYDGMNKLKLISDIYKLTGGKHLLSAGKLKSLMYQNKLSKNTVLKKEYQNFLYTDIFESYGKELPKNDIINVFSRLGLRIENEHSITLVNDIAGSLQGMELRTPFLNKDVIDFAASLPNSYKIKSYKDKKENKHILKQVLLKYLPEDLVYQKKMGFGFGVRYEDLLLHDSNQNFWENIILQTEKEIKIYKKNSLKDLLKKYYDGEKENINELLTGLILSLWYKHIYIKSL